MLAAVAAAMVIGSGNVLAQGRPGGGGGQGGPGGGNWDPEQMRQRMMERYREQLEVRSDAEWNLIQERIAKVTEARRDVGTMGMGAAALRGAMARGPRGNEGGGQQRGNRPGGTSIPEADDLEKAIEARASAEEIKAKLAKYREARQARQAALTKAQNELRQVLNVRQEAVAVMAGILD
ncbi:MAG: hypothetical protein KF833_06240 [Verrucomicrobiae bacterium]|nr:hypothetical protein [Verrucomicrobiae bacterium]